VRYRAIPSKVTGTIRAPPSKSYTHRAIILAALSGGPCVVRHALRSEDTDATVAGMAAFGAEIRGKGGDLRVSAKSLHAPAKPVDAQNSGTTLRLLAGVASLQSGETTLTGDSSLRKRPMGPLLDALNGLGAHAHARGADGRPPVDVRGVLRGGDVSVPGSVSSQFLSSLLIACPLAGRPSEIHVVPPFRSEPYVNATRHMLHLFGIEVGLAGETFRVPGAQVYRPVDFAVPGDFSSAAFPLVAAALTDGDVTVNGLDGVAPQGDRRIVEILKAFGAHVDVGPDSVRVRGGDFVAQTVDVGETPDLFPILAVLATQAEGETRFINGDQLRLKESDRIASTVAMLRVLGVRAEPTPDGCTVRGPTSLQGGFVDSQGDHRILMAAGVAGLVARDAVDISDPWCFRVSYPAYLDDLRALGALHTVVA
jgi:3-phosphoshikimate 1-carboxyvinyltransferase